MRTLLCLGVVFAFTLPILAEDRPEDKTGKHMQGTIVKVDREANTITIRGQDNKEQVFKVSPTTKYWGNDRQQLTTGLQDQQFKEGAKVWYKQGEGADNMTLTELRFHDPAGASGTDRPGNLDKDK